jgi:hypothetical protein
MIFPLRQERTTKEYAIIFSGRSIVSCVVAPDRSTRILRNPAGDQVAAWLSGI